MTHVQPQQQQSSVQSSNGGGHAHGNAHTSLPNVLGSSMSLCVGSSITNNPFAEADSVSAPTGTLNGLSKM